MPLDELSVILRRAYVITLVDGVHQTARQVHSRAVNVFDDENGTRGVHNPAHLPEQPVRAGIVHVVDDTVDEHAVESIIREGEALRVTHDKGEVSEPVGREAYKGTRQVQTHVPVGRKEGRIFTRAAPDIKYGSFPISEYALNALFRSPIVELGQLPEKVPNPGVRQDGTKALTDSGHDLPATVTAQLPHSNIPVRVAVESVEIQRPTETLAERDPWFPAQDLRGLPEISVIAPDIDRTTTLGEGRDLD